VRVLATAGLVLVGISACQSSVVPQPPRTAGDSLLSVSPLTPAAQATAAKPVLIASVIDLGPRAQQILVHVEESRAIVLMSSRKPGSRVLVEHADDAVYQPELALMWYRDGKRLNVLDLLEVDKGAPTPVTIAMGMPEQADRISIARGAALAVKDDGCEGPSVDLSWTETPHIQAFFVDAPDLRLVNTAWLTAHLERTLRTAGERLEFLSTGARVRVPKKSLNCMDRRSCGGKVAFGGLGLDLVLVAEQPGGDCIQRSCLLHDPKTARFATPPSAGAWASAEKTAPGPCGPYLFDQTQMSFLYERHLCIRDVGCRMLDGTALGWIEPGNTVGAPGNGDFDDQSRDEAKAVE
jgi:hypothetical protein